MIRETPRRCLTIIAATFNRRCRVKAGCWFCAKCLSPDLQQSPVGVVVLDVGSWVGRKLLQQRADGGWHLRQQDEGDQRPGRHLPGAVDRRATASVSQAETKTDGQCHGKLFKHGDGTAALLSRSLEEVRANDQSSNTLH